MNPANTTRTLSPEALYGWFELDEQGQVLYSRLRRNNAFADIQPNLVGKNFFEDIFAFDNIGEFRRRFMNFARSREQAENFYFGCCTAEDIVKVRVMMLRAFETGCDEHANLVILDIREFDTFE